MSELNVFFLIISFRCLSSLLLSALHLNFNSVITCSIQLSPFLRHTNTHAHQKTAVSQNTHASNRYAHPSSRSGYLSSCHRTRLSTTCPSPKTRQKHCEYISSSNSISNTQCVRRRWPAIPLYNSSALRYI
ncbi:hypothetical protein M3J09_004245, partial [Ascochyta lentis]